VLVQLHTDVERRFLDCLGEHLRDARLLDVDQVWLEDALRRLEPELKHNAGREAYKG
jgi:hypothetical protein